MSGYQSSASLTGALLASKGSAAPSGSVSSLLSNLSGKDTVGKLTDTGIRQDAEVRKPATRSTGAVSHNKKRATSARAPSGLDAASTVERIKLSLRLDEDQHLRLKLAAAHLRQSSQTILIAALDEYLLRHAPEIRGGDCSCLMSGLGDPLSVSSKHGERHGPAR